jgi:ABC-type nitrate/sulfonate/bicarbonate transport system permease component
MGLTPIAYVPILLLVFSTAEGSECIIFISSLICFRCPFGLAPASFHMDSFRGL